MKYFSYLNTAVSILKAYRGEVPFSIFIKQFFSSNKKYGGKDRKEISNLCYNYFRLGHAVSEADIEEKIITGSFLCTTISSPFLQAVRPEWNEMIRMTLNEKIALLKKQFSVNAIFPWQDELSENVDIYSFSSSFLQQPLLYLRTRPGKENHVKQQLTDAGFLFEQLDEHCIALPNNSKLSDVFLIDKDAVVQDSNSQRIAEFLQIAIDDIPSKVNAWDCCAASGGKSILLFDQLQGNVDLSVSDIRPSILNNLKERFKRAGIKQYKSFVADIGTVSSGQLAVSSHFSNKPNLIICDAPCTGSGTWARTPENCCFFKKEKIDHYAALQKNIICNSIPFLATGGYFIYITCSVFKKENEDAVGFISNEFKLNLVKAELLKGYDKKADSLFVAVFRNV